MKTLINKLSFLALCLTIGILSCKKEPEVTTTFPDVPTSGNSISTSIGGQIVDENGNAVVGANVIIGTNTMRTNINGLFLFRNIIVNENKAYVKVEKNGYFLGSRNISTKRNTVSTVNITLLSNSSIGNFNSASGGIITNDGVSLNFPVNSIKIEGGGNYYGFVNVALKFLDPNNTDLINRMPGDLSALNSNGDERVLETYGMVAVELTSPTGQKLNVADGKKIEITIPLSGAYLSDAPASIPLWFFDEINGIWREDGLANKIGSNYVGEVSHFSYWNFDWQNQPTFISGKVECGSVASAGARVLIKNSSGRVMGADYTDNMGNYLIRVPQSITLFMEIYLPGSCLLTSYYSATIGSFTSVSTIPTITTCPSSASSGTITATLEDCNGNPVINGVLAVNNGAYKSYFYPNSNGVINATLIYCSSTSVSVIGYDFTNLQSSISQSISTGATMNVRSVAICNNSVNQYINYNLDGTSYSILDQIGDSMSIYIRGTSNNSTEIRCSDNSTSIINFTFSGASTGTFNVMKIYVNSLNQSNSTNINTSVSSYGTSVGSFITGIFSGTFVDVSSGTTHNISGSFNLERDN